MRHLVILMSALVVGACGGDNGESDSPGSNTASFAAELGVDVDELIETPSGLRYQDLEVGTGSEAVPGSSVSVHYTGWLTDGTKFDSSVDRGQPFEFRLGEGMVIAGWDEGVAGMNIGGKRKLVIPGDLGYGAAGAGRDIPPNATLVFDVELLDVR